MKHTFICIVAMLVVMCSVAQSNLDGIYVGAEKICFSSIKKDSCVNIEKENRKKWKWYHLNYIKIKGDSVFYDSSPIRIHKRDTMYSASDGGFHYYRGTLARLTETSFSIKLAEGFCDYCGEPVEVQEDGTTKRIYRSKVYLCKRAKDGFWANDIFYRQTKEHKDMISEKFQPGKERSW